MTPRAKILHELLVVVNLAVVREPHVAVRTSHRLVAGRREIEDGQTAVTEHGRRQNEGSGAVRAAMSQRVGHPGNELLRRSKPGAEVQGSGYAAHAASI